MADPATRSPILFASDFPILRESLTAQFEKAKDFEVVACAKDKNEVIALVQAFQPKLVLLDLNIQWDDLCGLLSDIHKHHDVRSLIMADDLESSRVIQLLRHGASGVVPRRTKQELFEKSISTVLAGHFWVSRAMIADFVRLIRENPVDAQKISENIAQMQNSSPTRAEDSARFELTPREMQIIGPLVDGQTNKEIAKTFGISEYTVKHHLTNIYDKLGVYNRVELVLFAMNHQLCQDLGGVAVSDVM